MNQSPWYVENAARYERDRIREEMRQIRLGERARRSQPRPIALVLRVWHVLLERHTIPVKRAAANGSRAATPRGSVDVQGQVRH